MKNYRILMVGDEYKAQSRFLFFFWADLVIINNDSLNLRTAMFSSEQEAEDCINDLKKRKKVEVVKML